MLYPELKEFKKLAKKGNLVPVYRELVADMETPVSTFLKLAEGEPYAYLLESVEGGERWGRYSFISWAPKKIMASRPGRDPVAELKSVMKGYRPVQVKGLPIFWGGAVGYAAYDVVRFFEDLEEKPRDVMKLPDSVFMLTDHLVIFDHLKHTVKIVVCVDLRGGTPAAAAYAKAGRDIARIESLLKKPLAAKRSGPPAKAAATASNMTKTGFSAMVRRAKEYIRAGDIIQVVLSQRFSRRVKADAFDIYRALRLLNPSPYMFYMRMKDFCVIGSSPEILVRKEQNLAETRPIAGTRPRGKDEADELRLEKELLSDEKERAEHIMLVDLGRNDLGRVCVKGTVKVPELMKIEKYSHVMHIVSMVTGRLRHGTDAFDLFRACFPAGTLSGAPKIRAMQIIDELEPEARGPYGGAVGYFSFSGNMDMAITIRTMIVKGGTAFIQAGAGIVADSVPASEFTETKNKAAALFAAIDTAERGIDR